MTVELRSEGKIEENTLLTLAKIARQGYRLFKDLIIIAIVISLIERLLVRVEVWTQLRVNDTNANR